MLPRPIARTTPVVLDHGRIAIGVPALRSDRPVWQAILIGILAIAFAAIVLARVTDGGTSGAVADSPGRRAAIAQRRRDRRRGHRRMPTAAPEREPWTRRPAAARRRVRPIRAPSAVATQTYKVKSGDTLVGIAAKFGTTPKAIANAQRHHRSRPACTSARSSRSPDPGRAGQRWQPRQ